MNGLKMILKKRNAFMVIIFLLLRSLFLLFILNLSILEFSPRQTFVFSATLNNKLKEDLKRKKYKSKKINKEYSGTMSK